MNEEDAKFWAKDKRHQQAIVDAIFKNSRPRSSKSAIFMAGIPGAGKTELVSSLRQEGLKDHIVIEHDKLVEYIDGYTPEKYYSFRKAGSILVTRVLNECLLRNMSFVFDSTLSHSTGLRNIQKSIDHGFNVIIIYVRQNPASAWQLTKDREIVKKRAIEIDGFIKTCESINANLLSIFQNFKQNKSFSFWIVNKNGLPGVENSKFIAFDKLLNSGSAHEIEALLEEEYNVSLIKE